MSRQFTPPGSAKTVRELSPRGSTAVAYAVPIDPSLIDDVEKDAKRIARDVDVLMTLLEERVHETSQMTSLTLQSVAAHGKAVDGVTKGVTACTERTLQLIMAVDELSHDMAGVQTLSEQIKTLKGSLDWLEKAAAVKP
ncbi:hypothetical protein HK101_006245 [Irineochytrium annulatum]|nr:hypothetical protein HK101_006245 [Irineochytrium annulatum]